MPEIDRERLAKLLAMTTAEEDPLALVAIRKANEYLKSCNTTWAEVLPQSQVSVLNINVTRYHPDKPAPFYDMTPNKSPQEDGTWVPDHLRDQNVIGLMFRTIYAGRTVGNEGFWSWVDDVHKFFKEHGYLSQGRYDALRRCYARAVKRRRSL